MNLLARIKNWLTGSAYDGANYSPKRGYNFRAQAQSARYDATKAVRTELVKKSRDFEKNCGLYNRLADIFELYTVGSGLQITPASTDSEWNAKAKKWIDTWSKYADLTSRQSIEIIESMWARTWFVDGECFIILTFENEKGRNRPRIQTIESHLCETPPDKSAEENKTIVDGVQIDTRGRPIGYWFKREDGDSIRYELIEAKYVIHIFEPSRPGKYRELPFCTPVINELQDLWELDRLEMDAAKDAARTTNVIKTKTGEANPDSLRSARYGMGASIVTPRDGSSAERTQFVETVTGIKTVALNLNEDMQQYVSQRPSVVTQSYYVQRESKACAGIGIPRILVFPESMQGTVYRGALDMANTFFRARFMVIRDALQRVYEHVMGWAIANDSAVMGAPADWYLINIAQPRAVNVDVGYNMNAALAALKAGCTNYSLIYGPLGLDWREEFQRLKEQQKFAKSIGLDLSEQNSDQNKSDIKGKLADANISAHPTPRADFKLSNDDFRSLAESCGLTPDKATELWERLRSKIGKENT